MRVWFRLTVPRAILLLGIAAIASGSYVAYRLLHISPYERGRLNAESDYAEGNPVWNGLANRGHGADVDPEFGLPAMGTDHGWLGSEPLWEYAKGYNTRLRQLIESRGLPRDSQRVHLVPPPQIKSQVDDVRAASQDSRTNGRVRFNLSHGYVWATFSSGYECMVGPADGFTVAWTEDPEKALVGLWSKGKLTHVCVVRAGTLLQYVEAERVP